MKKVCLVFFVFCMLYGCKEKMEVEHAGIGYNLYCNSEHVLHWRVRDIIKYDFYNDYGGNMDVIYVFVNKDDYPMNAGFSTYKLKTADGKIFEPVGGDQYMNSVQPTEQSPIMSMSFRIPEEVDLHDASIIILWDYDRDLSWEVPLGN